MWSKKCLIRRHSFCQVCSITQQRCVRSPRGVRGGGGQISLVRCIKQGCRSRPAPTPTTRPPTSNNPPRPSPCPPRPPSRPRRRPPPPRPYTTTPSPTTTPRSGPPTHTPTPTLKKSKLSGLTYDNLRFP